MRRARARWPKPLPHRWVLGGLGGLCVDGKDHVLILNRHDVIDGDLNGGTLAPPMIEFDPEGNVVHSWGDLAPSGMVQKYTHDGSRLLLQIGEGQDRFLGRHRQGRAAELPGGDVLHAVQHLRRPDERRRLRLGR